MIITDNGRTLQLPDFLIPGAARSGTTKLYDSLYKHPSVFMPDQKEPMFFSLWGRSFPKEWRGGDTISNWVTNELDGYMELFQRRAPGQVIGEGSVWYLYDYDTTIANIRKLYGPRAIELKIIILLRNPVDRAWSHYLLKTAHHRESLPFDEAVCPEVIARRLAAGMSYSYDYIGFGRYTDQVRAWMQAFPHCRVWIFEDFYRNIPGHMAQISDFLGIPMDDVLLSNHKVNSSGRLRGPVTTWVSRKIMKPSWWKTILKAILPYRVRQGMKLRAWKRLTRPEPMPEGFRRKLTQLYASEIDRLEMLLGRSLDIWRASA